MACYSERLVRLWNEWQLSGLVLLSMLLQLLLLTTARYRRRRRPYTRWKAFFWVIHIGSKVLPTYCLGILSKATARNANADIEAFWAAILLFHLSGVDDFTALTLEDNKLWPRNGAVLLTQAGTAAYVFFHYFLDPGTRPLVLPFVMVFVASFVKCVEQVFALSHGKIESLWASVLGDPDPGPDVADTMDEYYARGRGGNPCLIDIHWESSAHQRQRIPSRPTTTVHTGAMDNESSSGLESPNTYEAQAQDINRNAESSIFASPDMFTARDFYYHAVQIGVDRPWQISSTSIAAPRSQGSGQRANEIEERPSTPEPLASAPAVAGEPSTHPSPSTSTAQPQLETDQEIRAYSSARSPLSLCNGCGTPPAGCTSGEMTPDTNTMSATIRSAHKLFSTFKVLFADGIFSFKDRRASQEEFSGKDASWAFKVIDIELSLAYDMLYTKASAFSTRVDLLIRVMTAVLTLASNLLVLFVTMNDKKYRLTHKGITYTLLLGAFLVDVVILNNYVRSDLYVVCKTSSTCCHPSGYKARWSESMAQYNLISSCLSSIPPPCPVLSCLSNLLGHSLLKKVGLLDFLDNMRNVQYVGVTTELKGIIFEELKAKESHAMEDNNYKPFTSSRGDWVLVKMKCNETLGWSIQGSEFDESLLMWHLATDLCYRSDTASEAEKYRESRDIARTLSNYLLYIMAVHPLMLSSSTIMAIKRFKDTCAEVQRFLLKNRLDESNAHTSMLLVDIRLRAAVVKGDKSKSVLWDGCLLAKDLQKMGEHKWQIICKVWVEMLCYAGMQCGGFYHAEQLRDGGEMLTFACFLMTHLGMGKHYKIEVGDATAELIDQDE